MGAVDEHWWDDAVIYQIYPRSFQDSNGDGVGDLAGIMSRLDHLSLLGVDAFWLSPIYPSPLADMGYDVADHAQVAPEMGTLGDFDRLVEAAHSRDLRVLLDLIPSHTSIEHPWFREHPDFYVWADEPPNNWISAFGGSAWTLDARSNRWYLHSFYPEQPDLDWRVTEVRERMADVVRFWTARGVDGFRVDAVQQLMKDEKLRDDPPATVPFPLPLGEEHGRLSHVRSGAGSEIGTALAAIREAAGKALLVGEVYRPAADLRPYLEHLDVAFAFELLHSPFEVDGLTRAILAGTAAGQVGWALSNHDFPRLATRLGAHRVSLAAMLLLTLPGPVFIYQGDEIGMVDGPGAAPPFDRAGRDPHRHPMQWTSDERGGFTSGTPWLPLTDPGTRSVAVQSGDPTSVLGLHRALIRLRRELQGAVELIEASSMLAYRRGAHIVALNLTGKQAEAPTVGTRVLSTFPETASGTRLAAGEGAVFFDE
ncbi:MAG: alpha-amylase family glycosyl hydrolase [Actinomycetota bacterium]|nr:alpha-amylase family glycosyl hydrolase [Actinomycetota bacterium]